MTDLRAAMLKEWVSWVEVGRILWRVGSVCGHTMGNLSLFMRSMEIGLASRPIDKGMIGWVWALESPRTPEFKTRQDRTSQHRSTGSKVLAFRVWMPNIAGELKVLGDEGPNSIDPSLRW
jgi:hypothetical protein